MRSVPSDGCAAGLSFSLSASLSSASLCSVCNCGGSDVAPARSGVMAALGLSLVVFGFGAVTPAAPAEGMAIASRELRRRGRTKRQARLTVGFSEWFAQRTFYAVAALDLLLVIALGDLSFADSWPFIIVAVVVIVAITGTAVAARRPTSAEWVFHVLAAIRIRRPEPEPAARRQDAQEWHAEAMAVVGPPRNRVRLALVSAAAVLADAATLWATCHAAGFHIHPELVLLARTVGAVAGWIPLLPSGLGVVEVAIPAILHRFGAPFDDALAATVVYRAAGTLLPALAGGVALIAFRTHRPDTRTLDRGRRSSEVTALSTDRFRFRSVLAVCAHPDDESFGLGAVISTFEGLGIETTLLCFTRGEASSLGYEPRRIGGPTGHRAGGSGCRARHPNAAPSLLPGRSSVGGRRRGARRRDRWIRLQTCDRLSARLRRSVESPVTPITRQQPPPHGQPAAGSGSLSSPGHCPTPLPNR